MNTKTVVTANELPQDVLDAIDSGHTIEAIKRLRSTTGLGLANAKVLVDTAARRRRVHRPHPALASEGAMSSGLTKLLSLLALVALGYYLWMQ